MLRSQDGEWAGELLGLQRKGMNPSSPPALKQGTRDAISICRPSSQIPGYKFVPC